MSCRMTLAVPYFNQLNDSKIPMGTLRHNTSEETEFLIIDNGSTDPVEEFIIKYLKPKRVNFIKNKENIGVLPTFQQIYENCETEIVAITHNDVAIYEKDWDQRVLSYFKEMPDLGLVGFFGSQGCGPIGERIQDVPSPEIMAGMSNMLEAEIHGMRLNQRWRSVAIFDGFMLICRMEMLKKTGGIDQRYHFHHYYDRDLSLESLRHGYKNIVVDVPCHHVCGMTANRSEYQTWIDEKTKHKDFTGDLWTHDENMRLFKEKWSSMLPLYVMDDFSFKVGKEGPWDYKGDPCQK